MNAPTQERRMSYEIKRQELLNGGGTLYDIGVNPNGNGKWFANLTYGFNVKLKMTDSENFMKNIKINRTTPVLG